MSDGPTLHLRRIRPVWRYNYDIRVTVGKLYKVVRRGKKVFVIIDDHGDVLKTRAVLGPFPSWRMVWVYPNGTELEELP